MSREPPLARIPDRFSWHGVKLTLAEFLRLPPYCLPRHLLCHRAGTGGQQRRPSLRHRFVYIFKRHRSTFISSHDASVPFVARYRKEITGALDDAQLRTLEERLNYLRELEERRTAILNSVREQGKLDAALEAAILAADSKGRLEDIYLPFKPKRRTKAEIAKEAGLGPPAGLFLAQAQDKTPALGGPVLNSAQHVAHVL